VAGSQQSSVPGAQTPGSGRVPAPLLVAAALVVLEAVLLVSYGVVLLSDIHSERLAMGATTSVFFVLYGVGLGACAWALRGRRSWARAPVVLAQLIQLGVGWSLRGGSTTVAAVVLVVLAILVLAGIFHPASLRALGDDRVEGDR
jgi:lysylphosphatidylglycerol synthetase-like protein (DUF2156 family)